MRILLLDIETAPNLAYVWGLWEQNIGINQIADAGYVLCWSAKWLGEDEVLHDSVHRSSAKKMLKEIHSLLNEADVVVHYNGSKFDIPTLNKEFLTHNMMPPSPYKQIDLLCVSRGTFKFQSNKLDYVSKHIGVGTKVKHPGFQLWIDCMANNPEAWKLMEEYNKGDVTLLEKVYYKFRPWIRNHPNVGAYAGGGHKCPNCAGTHLQRRGITPPNQYGSRYQRLQCKDCGTWSRTKEKVVVATTTVVGA